MPQPTSERIRLEAHPDGGFRFAVVADTHSAPHPDAKTRLQALRPDVILHAGDIGRLSVLDELGEVAPVIAVRGNIDGQISEVPEMRVVELCKDDAVKLRILLVHIAVYGPKLRAEIARRALAERASLVVCGHSHVPFIGKDRGLVLFNPGSIGPRRAGLPIVFGSLDIGTSGASLAHIDCETGKIWTPPKAEARTFSPR